MENDKLCIKNLLFTKALPNYVIPVPVDGYKVYPCDCGDKFIFESSYNDHVNRKSVRITYMCRYCNQQRTFFNRCNLLSHIRSHVFKTATINVADLIIEPLPLSSFKIIPRARSDAIINKPSVDKGTPAPSRKTIHPQFQCWECKEKLPNASGASRAAHYMQFTPEVYSCPICLFALPNICAVKTHLRLHLKCPPYYCPECGIHLTIKNLNYPYNHDCQGFKMMRATARLKCATANCLYHPNDYRDHMKQFHMKKVFKCPYCVVACFSEKSMRDHLKTHQTETKPLVVYKCGLCPGKFVLQSRMESHLKTHKVLSVFPCWRCASGIFNDVNTLIDHSQEKHGVHKDVVSALKDILSENETCAKDTSKPIRVYRVVKRCEQCTRSFTYKCQYDEIHNLPNECPYKCTSSFECSTEVDVTNDRTPSSNNITCQHCKATISQDWNEIKKHYAALHKSYKCMDAKIILTRVDVKKYLSQRKNNITKTINKAMVDKKICRRGRKRQNKLTTVSDAVGSIQAATCTSKSKTGDGQYECNICGDSYDQKLLLEKHMISHRDPCMAYQCMECGQSFVVKPSFTKHLLLEHNISGIEEYIKEKQCYNMNALIKYQNNTFISNEPLRENQCKICREDFEGPDELAKHFRVHGMAFLMKNNANNNLGNNKNDLI